MVPNIKYRISKIEDGGELCGFEVFMGELGFSAWGGSGSGLVGRAGK